jgi:hypothetical protein
MGTYKPLLPALALALSFSCGYSTTLNASDLSYSYAEGKFLIADSDDELEMDDALGIKGSYQIMEQVFVTAELLKGSGTAEEKINRTNREIEFDVDVDGFSLSGGYIHPIATDWDANVSLGYFKSEASGTARYNGWRYKIDIDDDGLLLSGGVRGKITPKIELSGSIDYYNGDEDSDTDFTLTGHYYILDNVSAGVSTEIDSDGTSIYAGGRFYF